MVIWEDPVAEVVLSQELPDVLDGVQLGSIGRQVEQGNVVGELQLAALLMPSRAVQSEYGVVAGQDRGADLVEVSVHHVDVDGRQDECDAGISGRADGAEDVGPLVAEVPGPARPGALGGPDVCQGSLLADTGLVLPP